ncbi:MAG: nucleotidyltransferase domain-containing protein [Methanophagales archaeon]|nr:nucleotidyltransferase domain-containing protein [Methanophagales archaeon]
MTTRIRIRDFVTTSQAWIFSVVSYDLGEGDVKCLLRYIPDESGDRVSESGRYRKLDFHESYAFLRTHQPGYVKDVHEVPKEDITEILRPEERLPRIAEREEGVRDIYELLGKAIPKDRIGITGSFLCGLNNQQSDLDFVVYGQKNFNLARQVIADATKEGLLTGIGQDVWKQIYNKRNPELSYDDFVAQEKRKKNRGVIDNTYFDLLYVRDWAEIRKLDRRDYEKGERRGYARITAEVKNAYFSFDSPAIYEIEHPEISKVLCFTHTYTGQASEGELIEARGVIEHTKHETRLVVGTTREAKGEWIKSLSLLQENKSLTQINARGLCPRPRKP